MSTQAKSFRPHKVGDEEISEAILHEIFKTAGVENLETVKRYIQTGRLLEFRLRAGGGVAIMPCSTTTGARYKIVKFLLHDWLRMSGATSKDYATPLDALRND